MLITLGPVTLEGRSIRLEPLRLQHAAALYAAGRAPEIWQYTLAEFTGPERAKSYIQTALDGEAAGRVYPFAVVDLATERVIGSTRFAEVDPVNRSAEIGWTWYEPVYWGTKVNPEAKFLLLQHAFETWGARRIWLKTDIRNKHSQAAMRKMGAQYEGTLRQHQLRRDGTLRDTVVFSVIDPEWPAVKAGLLARLQADAERKAE